MGRRIVVVGAGAVGGLYGARLAAAGHDVSFVARGDAEVLRREGLRVDSPDGDVVLAPGGFGVATDPADLGVADVVVVALKTTANAALAALLGPLVGPSTTLAVFQNGLGVEAGARAAAPGAAAVVGAMCFVCAAKAGPGHVVHQDYGAVTLAPQGDDDRAAAEAFGAELAAAGVATTVHPHLATARWRKLLWNVPFNALTTLLDLGTDEVLARPAGRALVDAVMAEVVAGGRACGADIGPDDAAEMVAMTESMVPYRTSMALDRAAGRPLEVEAMYAAPVAAAAAAGVAMPTTAALRDLLATVDVGNVR